MLATVINCSSNELAFLDSCIQEARCFSNHILVCFADHFFDGSVEDLPLLYGAFAAHPDVTCIQYPFSTSNFYGHHPTNFWHNMGRLIGSFYCKEEWILFLDVDEVAEGRRLADWLEAGAFKGMDAMRLANYWYFRESRFRAHTLEDTPLLVKQSALFYEAIMQEGERAGLFARIKGKKERMVGEEHPFFHHYSWVRTKEQMLKKVGTWGHRHERDWKALVEEEFSREFTGKDFVHGYAFEEVEGRIGTYEGKRRNSPPQNVQILTTRDVHKIDLQIQSVL